MIAARVLDAGQLLRVVLSALVAGVGVSLFFSLVIHGAVRAGERRAQARPLAAAVHAVLAALSLLACLAAIGFGVSVMLSK